MKVKSGPIAGPMTEGEWIKVSNDAMLKRVVTKEERAEYRRVLELYPNLSRDRGDLAKHYRSAALDSFEGAPIIEEQVAHRTKIMRAELLGDNGSPLEALLVDVILAAYQDYWVFATMYKQKTAKSFNMRDMEQWEKVLTSKEARYIRAVVELARVRRLLNLPPPQVNINLPGGQQVNIAGDVQT